MKLPADCETLNTLPGANKTSSERARRATAAASMAAGSPEAFELRAFFTDHQGGVREDPVTGSLNASAARAVFISITTTGAYGLGGARQPCFRESARRKSMEPVLKLVWR
jgi:hypothetical protein